MANTQGGRVTWVIDADNKAFKSSLQESESAAQSSAAAINRTGQRLAGDLANTFGAVGNILSSTLTAGANLATSALVALGIKGITSANQLQSLQLQMNGLTKSMELGAKAMAGAYQYAQKSPFQLPDVAATTKTLIAFGLSTDEAVKSLETLGNVSITTGIPLQSIGGIFGQVSAQGKLMLGDIRQLTENGIAILPALQKQFGKTAEQVQDMATAGEISFDQFRKALSSLVDPSILDQLQNTLPRQLDRLNGSVRILSNAFVGVGVDAVNGFQQASNGIAAAVVVLVKGIADTLRLSDVTKAATAAGNAFVPLINYVTQLFKVIDGHSKVGDFLTGFFNTIAGLGPALLPILALIALSFGRLFEQIPVIGSLLGGLQGAFSSLGDAIANVMGSGIQVLFQAFGAGFNAVVDGVVKGIGLMIDTVQKLPGVFTAVVNFGAAAFDKLSSAVGAVASAIDKRFPAIGNVIGSILDNIQSKFDTVAGVIDRAKARIELNIIALSEAFKANHPKIVDFANDLKDRISSAIEVVSPKLAAFASAVKDKVGALADYVGPKLQTLGKMVGDGFGNAFDAVGNGIGRLGGFVGNVMSSIGGSIINGVGAIIASGALLGDKLPEQVNGALKSISEKGPEMINTITSNIQGVVQVIANAAPQILAVLPTLIFQIVSFLQSNGPQIIQTFANIVIQMIQTLTRPDVISNVVSTMISLVGSIINALFQIAPVLLEAFFQVVIELVNQLADPKTLDMLVNNTVNFVLKIADILIQNLPTLINAIVTLLTALIDKITQPDILDKLIQATVTLIVTIVTALIQNLPKLIEAGVKLILALAGALTRPENLQAIWNGIKQIIQAIWDAITKTDWVKLGGDIVRGLWNGISNLGAWIGSKIKGFGEGVMKNLKDFFGIHSPSRLMRDEIGKNLGLGIALGITNSTKSAVKAATTAAGQISGAFNPIADGTFDSNYNVQGTMAPVAMSDFGSENSSVGNKIEIQQNNTINTDVDMDKVTRDLTWELSRA